jgi:hypothetical protein
MSAAIDCKMAYHCNIMLLFDSQYFPLFFFFIVLVQICISRTTKLRGILDSLSVLSLSKDIDCPKDVLDAIEHICLKLTFVMYIY